MPSPNGSRSSGCPTRPLVKAEQRKRRQDGVTAMVAAGLERERKFLRACGKEDASTATAPSEVDGGDMTTSSDCAESDGICPACEEPCRELSGGLCLECCVCPPEGDEESPDELADEPVGALPLPELPRLDEFAA